MRQLSRLGGLARLARALFHRLPVGLEQARRHHVDAHRNPAALAGQQQRVRLGRDARHGDRRVRLLVGLQVHSQPNVRVRLRHHVAPMAVLAQARLGVVPEPQHLVQSVARHAAVLAGLGLELEHLEVARESARSHSPHEAAFGHVIELGYAVRDHERVVIGHAGDAGAELYPLGAGQHVGDQQVGRGDVLPLRGEMLAYPSLVKAKPVERNELLYVGIERLRDVRSRRVQRHREETQFHTSRLRVIEWGGRMGAPPAKRKRKPTALRSPPAPYPLCPLSLWDL